MLNDLRFALRQLRKNPGFTAVVILSLAPGIGANTTIFSLIDAVLLKLLPVKDPQQLVVFAHRDPGLPSTGSNYPLYKTLRDGSQSFSDCFAFWPLDFRARTGAEAEPARGASMSARATSHPSVFSQSSAASFLKATTPSLWPSSAMAGGSGSSEQSRCGWKDDGR